MPTGMANYVRGQGLDVKIESTNGKDLARRRAVALNAKIQPKVFDHRSAAVHDRRTVPSAPTHIQPIKSHNGNGEDLFAGSVLSDSDDTTRDLGSPEKSGYQDILYSAGRQDFGGGNAIKQLSESGFTDGFDDEDEEQQGCFNDANDLEDDLADEDGQSRVFSLESASAPMSNTMLEKALRLRESQRFSEAEKLHNSKFGLSHISTMHPGISGRFTAANNVQDGVRRHHVGQGSTIGTRYESLNQGSNILIPDDLPNHNSTGYADKDGPQHDGQRRTGQLERGIGTVSAMGSYYNKEDQAQDPFGVTEMKSESSAISTQSSPLQCTPRANGQSSKQTRTFNGKEKRKQAEPELDYDKNTLSSMKYSELKDQPFDSNPDTNHSAIPESLCGLEASLEDRLVHFKDLDPSNQINFFAQMPLDQWEQSGEWFLGQFGDIMSKLKDARRARRDASKAFEEELASREEAVRTKAESIQEVFRQMRASGEDVLRGRTP